MSRPVDDAMSAPIASRPLPPPGRGSATASAPVTAPMPDRAVIRPRPGAPIPEDVAREDRQEDEVVEVEQRRCDGQAAASAGTTGARRT